ncbi:MAG: sigma-70 family RNA polymerase sigma factor [Polyangia bacterium]
MASASDRVMGDGSSGSAPLSASERAKAVSEREERVGASADDAMLARAALVGQVWAQREIWFRFAPMIYGLFRRALGPRHDADDLTQEVFLRVFRRLYTLEKASAIRSFVYSVAVRVLSEEIRRIRVRRRIVAENHDPSMSSSSSPTDFETRETLVYVQRMLDQMRDKYRAVFVLRHVDGMELHEIAVGLDISLATVKRYLNKALATIHKSLPKEGGRGPTGLGSGAPSSFLRGGR